MSIIASKWAYTQRVGQPGAKAVLVALADHADEDGYCFPSQQRLANMTEIAPRSVRRHLVYLETVVKLIRREERRTADGKYISDGYYLLAPAHVLNPYDSANETRDKPLARRPKRPKRSDETPEPPLVTESVPIEPADEDPTLASGQSGQRPNWPAANLAKPSGQIGQSQRPNWPSAKLATELSVESDEPSIEPSVEPPGGEMSADADRATGNGKAGKGTRVDPTFRPTAETIEWARAKAPDVNVADELEAFLEYWQARAHQATKLNWDYAFRSWLRKSQPQAADRKRRNAWMTAKSDVGKAASPPEWKGFDGKVTNCPRCFGSGMETVPGKGARKCDHKPIPKLPPGPTTDAEIAEMARTAQSMVTPNWPLGEVVADMAKERGGWVSADDIARVRNYLGLIEPDSKRSELAQPPSADRAPPPATPNV